MTMVDEDEGEAARREMANDMAMRVMSEMVFPKFMWSIAAEVLHPQTGWFEQWPNMDLTNEPTIPGRKLAVVMNEGDVHIHQYRDPWQPDSAHIFPINFEVLNGVDDINVDAMVRGACKQLDIAFAQRLRLILNATTLDSPYIIFAHAGLTLKEWAQDAIWYVRGHVLCFLAASVSGA